MVRLDSPQVWQKGFTPILIVIGILILILVGGGAYYFGTKNSASQNSQTNLVTTPPPTPTETNESRTNLSKTPKLAAFMRDGDIWVKDFSTDKEIKVSKTANVRNPKLSPQGKYVTYHPLIHAAGGFPRGNLYLADTKGIEEIILGEEGALGPDTSRITWSDDEKYLGFILFSGTGKAKIYDIEAKKIVLEKDINIYDNNILTVDKPFKASLNCQGLAVEYQDFCKKFEGVLYKELIHPDLFYKTDEFSNSKFTKTDYKLSTSRRLENGLVVLQYYTGEPENPESEWGIGGGSFFPGYDKGVTETYTILLDETQDKIIIEIQLAIDSDFIF
jgi:hypothetical protein